MHPRKYENKDRPKRTDKIQIHIPETHKNDNDNKLRYLHELTREQARAIFIAR